MFFSFIDDDSPVDCCPESDGTCDPTQAEIDRRSVADLVSWLNASVEPGSPEARDRLL